MDTHHKYSHKNDTHNDADLFATLTLLESPDEARNFMIDLCTPSEIRAFTERWRVCQLLDVGRFSYREIREMTGASLMTIGRVARFLNDEPYGGYKKLLEKTKKLREKK
jgi:TrpR-related protein YerC/YecD